MRTTIDSAGRVVIPKALRDELGLDGGASVEVELRDGHIELSVPVTAMRLEDRGGVLVAVTDGPVGVLTQEVVRATLERTRR